MNYTNPLRSSGLAVTIFATAMVAPVNAASISFVDQFKNVSNLQTGNGNTLTGNGAFYSADLNSTVPNAYTSANFVYPGPGSPATLTVVPTSPTDYHFQTPSFANKAAMDTAFPFGTYTFHGINVGTDTASYSYTADDYAQANPFLTDTDFSSLQGMNASHAFTFHLSPFVTGSTASSSFIFLTIFDFNLGTFVFNDGFLAASTTTVVLPANTLAPGHSFVYELDYSNRDIITGTGGVFSPQLGFDIRTDGTFSTSAIATPEPATAAAGLIGLALIAGLAYVRRR